MPFKTFMKYENGKLIHTDLPDSKSPSVIIPIISVTGGIDFCIKSFVATNNVNGTIYIESKDHKLFIRYDITPKEAIPAIDKAVMLFYKDREIVDDPNPSPKQ